MAHKVNNIDSNQLKTKKKNKTNLFVKLFSLSLSLFIIILFVLLVSFILFIAIQGISKFGIVNILFSSTFDPSQDKYSFWIPFSSTILTSLISLLIAVPLSIKVAIFTKYRLNKNLRKYVIIIFQTLSGIPSVIFGLFAANSLGILLKTLFSINPNSIFNASIMLAFMISPTIVTMSLDSLNNVNDELLANPQALGNSKSRAIYKVCKKAAKSGIIISVIVALSRAIGESMAVSMILQSSPSSSTFSLGFFGLLNSSTQTIGAYISTAMFADSEPEKIRPLLYAFGLIMLFMSLILNMFILVWSKNRHKSSNSKFRKIELFVEKFVLFIPIQIKKLFEKYSFTSSHKLSDSDLNETILYMKDRTVNYKFSWIYPSWKIFTEILSISICVLFLSWIVGDILVNGIKSVSQDPNLMFVYSKNSISQSFVNTLLIVIVCIAIGFPISLMCAIYLNEYVKEGKLKRIIIFFLDSLGTTPSIIFGMFGLLFFIQTLGMTSSGKMGNSLIAGCLTLVLVVLPSFIRLLEQSLKNVPLEIRLNSYALGNTKWETIRKLVLPIALISITSAIISTIGRIFSETAPLYLTAGLSSSSVSALDRPGTTLTTHIYAQLFSPNPNSIGIQYQAATLSLIIVLVLVIVGYIALPNKEKIKKWFMRAKDIGMEYIKN